MQSPFEAVKALGPVFRTFSGGGGMGIVKMSSGGGSQFLVRNEGESLGAVQGQGQGRPRCYSTGATNEGVTIGNSSGGQAGVGVMREGSLFAFAASSSLFWPVGGGGGKVATGQQKRHLWGWLNSIFNRVDESRIEEVGPDRACAEWLLRCGAGVKWDKGPDEWLRDYNSLPVGSYRSLKIVEIDATDSAVMHIGFPYFRGLKYVKKAVFHRCGYMEDEALRQLGYLKDTLEDLQISSCGNVTDEGILTLVQLKNLKRLKLYDFLEVRDRKKCLSALQQALPHCVIDFAFARESDRDQVKA